MIHSLSFAQNEIPYDIEKLVDKVDEGTHIEIGLYKDNKVELYAFEKVNDNIKVVKNNPDKLFEIGSLTKPFTAFITHHVLQEDDNISVDSKLKEMDLDMKINKKNESKVIHLLTHTSNLPKMPMNYLWGMIFHNKNPYLIYSKKRVLRYYKKHKTKKTLGKKFNYTNFGYGVLGLILEDLEKKDYSEIFNEKITEGLGMSHTFVGIKETDKQFLFENDDCLWQWNKMKAAGGVYSNMNDLLLFVNTVINKNETDAKNQKALEAMEMEIQTVDGDTKTGIGWWMNTANDKKILYHDGGTKGYKAFMTIQPKNKTGVVILSKNCGLRKNSTALKEIGLELIQRL